MPMTKQERRVLDNAATRLEAFVAASRGERTRCASFDHVEFTREQRRQLRIYLETWVLEPLRALQTHGVEYDDHDFTGWAREERVTLEGGRVDR